MDEKEGVGKKGKGESWRGSTRKKPFVGDSTALSFTKGLINGYWQ